MARCPPHSESRTLSPRPPEQYQLSIAPATKQDIPALARIHVSSLSANLLFRLCWPNQTSHYKSVVAGLEKQFNNPEFEWWLVKAINEEVTIMGWAAWTLRPADLGPQNSSASSWFLFPGRKVDDGSNIGDSGGFDTEDFPIVPGLPNYLHSHTQVIVDDWLLGKKHLLLNALFVAPRFQHRGIGTALLNWGNNRADKEGLPCFLKSTPTSWPLYKELGWKEVGVLEVDLRDWVRTAERDGSGWGMYRICYGVRLPDVWKGDRNNLP